jgi:phosphoglycerate dehydrogenase-like enzyme
MTGLLLSAHIERTYGAEIAQIEAETGQTLERIVLPEDPEARFEQAVLDRIEIAFYSIELFPRYARPFFSAVRNAPNVRWMQLFSAGFDHPIFAEMLQRGVRLTNVSGATAEPIAQTAIAGLLHLARPFRAWEEARARHEWFEIPDDDGPDDLRGQTLVVLGLGEIGSAIARIAQALGLHVVGVRRSPRRPEDPVHELHPPAALDELLPRADWLVVAWPLTSETRYRINAEALGRLPRGAHVMNVARGDCIEEAALIEALRSGQLGGAYLDVFAEEPLPPDSPFWDMPNVVMTPHNSSVSRGNERRIVDVFLANLRHWLLGEPLEREVRAE